MRFPFASVCLLLVLAAPASTQTVATASALAVEQAFPFGTATGKLLLLGKCLVFVDDQRPDASFVVAKSIIESLSADNMAITIQREEDVRNRSGEVKRLSFRALPGSDRRSVPKSGMATSRPTGSPLDCRPLARALWPFTPTEIGRGLSADSGDARHSHPARVSTRKLSRGSRACQFQLDSRRLAAVS